MRLLGRLFRTKSLDAILSAAEKPGQSLKRTLGPIQLTALGIGAVIGAGIFATVGTAAAGNPDRPGAGPAILLSFIITGVACAFCALCYAELASMIPISGSAYTYSYATLGEVVAWIIGWDLIIEYAIGNVAVAISWSGYFNELLRGLSFGGVSLEIPAWLRGDMHTALACRDLLAQAAQEAADPAKRDMCSSLLAGAPFIGSIPIVMNLPAVAIVALLTVVLVIGIRESSYFNAAMVVLKLVILAFFVGVGLLYVKPENYQPFAPGGWAGIQAGAAIIFFSYIGFDAVSTAAEETRNPKRDLPIGLIASLAICTVLYLAVAAVLTGMLPSSELNTAEPLAKAFSANGIDWAAGLVALGAVIATTAVLLVFQLGQPRIFFSMSRDGLLPRYFARVHPRFRTPHVTTIWTGVVVALFSCLSSLDIMVELTNIGTLFAFVLVCVGVILLRYREPARTRPFRLPWIPLAPVWAFMFYLGLTWLAGGADEGPGRALGLQLVVVCGAGLVFNGMALSRRLRHEPVPDWLKTDLALAGIGTCLYLMDGLPAVTWWRFGAWLLAGLLIYLVYGYWNSALRSRTEVTS
ncbi:MAG: amino acid permease [Candidatus Polarisedimenticolia bacterium]